MDSLTGAIVFNPLDLASLINGFWRTHKIGQWVKAIAGVQFSIQVSFLMACGTKLQAGEHWAQAVGFGMIAAASAGIVAAGAAGFSIAWFKPEQLPAEVNRIEVDEGKK